MYSLWDGSIGGEIIEIMPKQKLAQTWKPQDWMRVDSVVTFKLTPHGKGTRVDLVHVNVENTDYDGTSEGWNEYYLGAIQRMFERKSKSANHAKAIKAAKKPAKKKGVRKKASSRRKS